MVISLAGEWDIYRKEELQARLRPAYEERQIVFDLTTAKYVTSTLICELILAHKHREQSAMPPATIAVKSAFVRRLLAATGIERLFPIYGSVDAALCDGSQRERAV